MHPAAARTRTGYKASFGSGSRITLRSPSPPSAPTAAPTAIWRANSPTPWATADTPAPVAPNRLIINAMPTGSLAPDSPSRMVPDRPTTSRRPSTENTTAGSVGDNAVPINNAAGQSNPNSRCAATANAPAVTTVPATPSHTTATAADRNRRHPMCMPPSNRMKTKATVTICSSTSMGTDRNPGNTAPHTAAAIRNTAGAGTRSRVLTRCENTASSTAADTTATTAPNPVRASTTPAPSSGNPSVPGGKVGFRCHRSLTIGASASAASLNMMISTGHAWQCPKRGRHAGQKGWVTDPAAPSSRMSRTRVRNHRVRNHVARSVDSRDLRSEAVAVGSSGAAIGSRSPATRSSTSPNARCRIPVPGDPVRGLGTCAGTLFLPPSDGAAPGILGLFCGFGRGVGDGMDPSVLGGSGQGASEQSGAADDVAAAAQVAAQEDELAQSLTALSRLSSSRLSLEDLLTRVAIYAVQAIPGADGAGLTLIEVDRADTIVKSAPFVREVDDIQYGLGEGPCITAAATGMTMRSGSLGGDRRWPRFGPRVGRLGVHSVL